MSLFKDVKKKLFKSGNANPNWSEEKDRKYHDWLFSQIDRDHFHFHYTGYITIKRFGDLVSTYLQDCSRILDAGCGPGDITCYLAQKFPDKTFLAVDHSQVGVQKGEKNRERLGLQNIRFESRDFFKDPPSGPFDIVLFLDSFHHFTDPGRVIEIIETMSDRVLMIEPRGDSQGNWIKDVDFDWVNYDLQKIRTHINRVLQDEDQGQKIEVDDPMPAAHSATADGEAIENRYDPKFYERLLKNFDLEVRGTVAGLGEYWENVYERTESNYLFNRILADVLESIDKRLMASGRDIFAKHWIIYGEKKGKGKGSRFDGFSRYYTLDRKFAPVEAMAEERIVGFFDLSYNDWQVPEVARAGREMWGAVCLTNRGFGTWSSSDPKNPVNVSYHWLSENRETVVFDGLRTKLVKPLGPGESASLLMKILAPEKPGRYILQLDVVQESVAWFSQRMQTPPERTVVVEP